MGLVTVVYSMIAGVCLTLAAVHLPVWWRNRESRSTLAFSAAAICTAAIAACELMMLKAPTPQAYVTTQRWANVPTFLLLIALAGFAFYYLEAGRRWLAIAAIGLRGLSLVINFTVGESLNYLEVTSLRSVPLMGELVSFPVGVRNPWQAIGHLAHFLLMLFFADAAVTTWRRGRRAAAMFVGGSLTFFMFARISRVVFVYWQGGVAPTTLSLFALGVVAVMGYALSADLLRARQLIQELGEKDHEATLVAEAAKLGTWTHDMSRDVVLASPKWRELLGFSPAEPVSLEAVLQRIHVDDRSGFGERLAKASRDRSQYHAEFRVPLADGRLRWLAAMGRVDFDAGGALRMRGACIDITARKQAEQEMLRLRQDLAHVGRVSVMGHLAASLAHEINQPLGAILRNAEAATLFMQDPSPDLQEVAAILEDIKKDDQRAGEVIDRMRALLRRQEVAMTPLDVGQILGDVARLLRPDALARHVALILDLEAALPPVRGDRVQIQQVLLNLILNGMDALDGLDEHTRSITVGAGRQGSEYLEISVADTGPGIPPDQLDRVFDPFFTTKTKGIGMGLSISRSIVESHGGRLWVESNAGGGATFRFTLPLAG